MTSQYDILLKNGHVLDPTQGINQKKDIAFLDGKIALITEMRAICEKVVIRKGLGLYQYRHVTIFPRQ